MDDRPTRGDDPPARTTPDPRPLGGLADLAELLGGDTERSRRFLRGLVAGAVAGAVLAGVLRRRRSGSRRG